MQLSIFQRSWDIALGPIKQIPMNLFIMWMAGNTISIFPIMMVGMMFIRPIQAIIAAQASKLALSVFNPYMPVAVKSSKRLVISYLQKQHSENI